MVDRVKIRIALEVNEKGEWYAQGWSESDDRDRMPEKFDDAMDNFFGRLDGTVNCYWLTAEVETPNASPLKIRPAAVEFLRTET